MTSVLEEPDTIVVTSTGSSQMSKSEAVRKALAAGKSSPKAGVKYIKTEFELDVSTGLFSSIKHSEAKKAKALGVPKAMESKKEDVIVPAVEPIRSCDSGLDVNLADIKSLDIIIDRYGPEKFAEITAFLARRRPASGAATM